MASLDESDPVQRRESWTTDDTSDVGSEGSGEWLIAKPKYRSRYNPLRFRIGRCRSLLRLSRSRPIYRLGCLLLVLAGIQAYLLHRDYIGALAAKFSPTSFTRISTHDQQVLADPRWQLNTDGQDRPRWAALDNQARWKTLGSGYEGDTFAFDNMVIKVFKPGRSPLRNCVPGMASKLAWPSEIPVSLLLGGLVDTSRPDQTPPTSDDAQFVPILDYFLLPSSKDDHLGEWHLITPFLSSGTLDHLAKRLRSQEPALKTDEVDAHFRPSFHRILKALVTMHSEYDLCHDDVKMDNIFVMDYASAPLESPGRTTYSAPNGKDTHWLLGDLGNAREPSHGYHTSLLWSHDNGQHPDCRVNDLRRLVKSYILFLQAATMRSAVHRDEFIQSFLSGSTPWSRLYWYTMNMGYGALETGGAAAAGHIHNLSATLFSPVDAEGNMVPHKIPDGPTRDEVQRLARPVLEAAWFDHAWLGINAQSRRVWSVGRELGSGLGLSERWAKVFGTMGIMKTPARRC